jgi:hypothetical protein
MTPLKASLVALALLLAPQAAGHPDELAELFPQDAVVFAEVAGVADLARDWKAYAETYLPAAGRREALEALEKTLKEGLQAVPERLLKDLEKALPTLQRAAVGLWVDPARGPQIAAAFSSSDPAVFTRIVEDGLKAFSSQELRHGEATLLRVRRIGDASFGDGVWVGAAGRRLVAAADLGTVTRLLDRAAGKDVPGGDLRAGPSYKAFAPAPAGASVRAFWSGMGTIFELAGAFGRARRQGAHEMDKANAFLGLDKIGTFLVEASLKPGRIRSTARLQIDSPCPLYDVWRQPAGPKELLAYVPDGAGVVAHVNATSGKAVWAGIERIMRRFDEIEAQTAPEGRPRRTVMEQTDRSFEREFGVKPAEFFGAVADEAAFALVGPDAFAFDPRMLNALLFSVKVVDAAQAREIVRKITAKMRYAEREQAGTTWWDPPADAKEAPTLALKGRVCLIGGSKETVEAALAAPAGPNVYGSVPAEVASASKLIRADLGGFWKGLQPRLGPELPADARNLALEARTWVTFEEDPREMRLRTSDNGLGLAVQGGWLLMPAFFMSIRPMRPRGAPDVEPAPEPPAPPPVPPLAEADLAARVKAAVADLQADDVVKREEAAQALRALGPPAIPAMVQAIRTTSDAETRGRLIDQLVKWRAYDAMPEVLARKIDAFLEGFRRAPTRQELQRMMGDRIVNWYRNEGMPWPYCIEPNWVNEDALRRVAHVDVLQYAAGARAAAEAVKGEQLPLEQRKSLAAVLAYADCGKAGDALVAARDGARDADVKVLLQIALGWSEDPACRRAVIDGLSDGDPWIRRASFIAAERSTDAALAGRLIELLSSKDPETRWNASYTLRGLTKRKVSINIYAPAAEVEAATAAATSWWAANKATFTPSK